MEKDSPVKPSVAELAGMFKGHTLPMPTGNEERKPVKRRPPCSLQLHNKKDSENEHEKPSIVSPHPPKGKLKNSPLFEKLQANLALSPTALLPSPTSPEVKLQPTPFSPSSPCSPLCPALRPPQQSSKEEVPVSFEQPAEGTPLLSINKSRARLSFKRRPPTRQHRQSASEEAGAGGGSDPDSPKENGEGDEVFEGTGGEAEQGCPPHPATVQETEEDRDSSVAECTTGTGEPEKGSTKDTQEPALATQEGKEVAGEPQASDSLEAHKEEGRHLEPSSAGSIEDTVNNDKRKEEEALSPEADDGGEKDKTQNTGD